MVLPNNVPYCQSNFMYELYYGTEKHKSDIFNVNEYEKETSNRRL